MHHLPVRTAVVAAVATVAALLAAPVAAAPTWVDQPDVADTGDQVTQLHVNGRSVLTWVDAATNQVVLAQRADGGAWSTPQVIASPVGTPTIDLAPAGIDQNSGFDVVYHVGSTLSVVTVRSDPLPGQVPVSAPRTLSTTYVPGTLSAGDSIDWAEQVGVGQQRLVTMVNNSVEVVRPAAAVSYQTVQTVYVDPSGPNPSESMILYRAWVAETAGGAQQLYLQERSGATEAVGRAGSTFSDVVLTNTGELVFVEKTGSAAATVRVAQLSRNLDDPGVATVADVPGGPGAAADPSISKLDGGGRVLVWREQDGGSWAIRTSTAPAVGGGWAGPVTLDSGSGTLADDQFAASSSTLGQVATWCHLEAGACSVRGAFRDGTSWRPVTTLGTVAAAADAHLADLRGSYRGSTMEPVPPVAWTDGGDDVRYAALDHTGPTTVLKPKPVATFTGGVTARWSSVDDWSRVATYRVRSTLVPFRGVVSYEAPWHQGAPIVSTDKRLPVGPGQTRCYSVSATDGAGNSGPESANSCIIAPIDDRLLTRSASWRRVSDSRSYRGTLLRSNRRGATLTVRNYPWPQVMVLVRRLPAGGKIEVLLNGTRIRTLSTAGTSRRMTALVAPSDRSKYRNLKKKGRTLQIRVITNGKPVLIDGLFLGADLPAARAINELTG